MYKLPDLPGLQVYGNRQPLEQFKRFVWRDQTRWLSVLHGVNFDFRPPNDLYIDPVYVPLIDVQQDGGVLYIDIHWFWRLACRTIILMPYPPFFWTGKSDKVEIGEEH